MSYQDREAWLLARRKGIGGSDAAKILGVSSWGGPLSVWMDKTGRSPLDTGMSEAAEMGIELEETVARVFTKRTGLKVARRNATLVHPQYPWMLANIDRRVVGQNKGLECKTTHFTKGTLWEGDDLPDDYYCQCQHYISVMGWESCYIAALIGGQKFKYKEVVRDDAFIGVLIEAERFFWDEYVCKGVMPPASEYDDLTGMYPEEKDEALVPASDEYRRIAEELAYYKAEIKRNEADAVRCENLIKQRIGDMAGIAGIATWKNNKSSEKVDWQAVAAELSAPCKLIARHTAVKPGARVLRLDKSVTTRKEREAA